MRIYLFAFILCLTFSQCTQAQEKCLERYADNVKDRVNSGHTIFVTIEIKSEGQESYIAFLRTLDIWYELYGEIKYDKDFKEVIHSLILKQELILSNDEFKKMKKFEIDSALFKSITPKEVIQKYIDNTGVALISIEEKELYSALAVLAADCIMVYEEIEGPEINIDYARKKYLD